MKMSQDNSRTFLDDAELKRLTGRIRAPAQFRILQERGIPAILDGNGKPIVLRSAIEDKMGGKPRNTKKSMQTPNWDALDVTRS